MMKSSRRKQTNPNRVAAGTRDPDLGITRLVDPDSTVDAYPPPGSGGPGSVENDVMNDDESLGGGRSGSDCDNLPLAPPPPLSNGQSDDYDAPLDMHVGPVPVREKFSNYVRDLELRRQEDHGPEMKKPRMEPSPSEDFPTAYHRLGRELFESTAEMPLTNGHLEGGPSPPVSAQADSTPSPRETPGLLHHAPPKMMDSRPHEDGSSYHDHPPPPLPPPLQQQPTSKNNNNNNNNNNNGKDGQGDLGGSNKERIFHMDAYCELCDREFCNKYFLKTHKANKHGIYEDNSPPASSVPLPFPGLMMPQDPLASFNFKMDSMKPPPNSDPILPWSFKLDPTSQAPKKPDSSPGLKLGDPSLPMFPLPMPTMESPKPPSNKHLSGGGGGGMGSGGGGPGSNSSNHLPISSSATSMLTNITNSIKSSSSNAPPANDPSMEDYCHICQKHFCNKYYLKKHKQDVHGIAPENPPNSSNKRSRSSSLMDHPMTSSNPMILPQPLVSLAGMPNLPGMPGLPNMSGMPNMPNMPPGVMVINPYSLPPVAIIPAGSLMPGQQLPPPPHPMISQPMTITPLPDSALLPPAPPTPSSMPNASGPGGHSPNKPSPSQQQEGGVHCNICSKEFCNDFYLQIHRESKHGIKRGSEDGSRDKALSLVKERDGDKRDGSRPSPPPLSSVVKNDMPRIPSRSPHGHHTPGPDGPLMVCNLCNKDFTNKYLYRIHRIHDHGLNEMIDPTLVENGELPNKEDAMRSMNESLMRMAADASAVGYASSFAVPPVGKSPESAVCEICNKEMTNQYFLRLHKFNIHGIDPSTNEKYEKRGLVSPVALISKPKTPPSSGSLSISSPSQPLNLTPHNHHAKPHMLPFLPPKMDFKDMPPFGDFGRDFKSFRDMPSFLTDTINNELFARSQNPVRHMDLNFFGLPTLGKLPGEDNVKLNFDPEAYCDICKKEFCSKYFLRTHKQNIHGIKTETTTSSNAKSTDSEKMAMSMSPLKPNVSNSNGKPKDGYEKSSWRWKEPVNSSRVICEICNKEVCNKYFLRTHKLKKHGIQPTSQSPNMSMSGSPVASDCDTASNASSLADEKPMKLDPFSLPQMIPLPPTDRLNEKYAMSKAGYGKSKEEVPLNNNTEQSETCNICNRRFKNLKWLKDHILKDHSEAEALDMRAKNSSPVYTCQVCGLDFPAELSVQLHLIQEHNARVTLNTEEPQIPTEEPGLPNGEGKTLKFGEHGGHWCLRKKFPLHGRRKKYVCSRCGFDTHWLSTLLEHERGVHGVACEATTTVGYSCGRCRQTLASPNALSAHLVTSHGLTVEEALGEIKTSDESPATTFKCSHCPAVFPSQSWAMAHVRHVHIRGRRDLPVKNSYEKLLLRCPSCPFKTHFSIRLQRHIKCRHRRTTTSSNNNNNNNNNNTSSSVGGGGIAHFQRPAAVVEQHNNNNPVCSSASPKTFLPPAPAPARPTESASLPNSGGEGGRGSAGGFSNEDPAPLAANSAMYKSIAASLLSAPESGRPESPSQPCDREELLLQNYKLPINASPVDPAPFKMATQTSAQSAVVGL